MASTYWERSVIEELQAIRAAIEAVAEALRSKPAAEPDASFVGVASDTGKSRPRRVG